MSLAVIGAGLGRTGTLSVKVALEQLGLGRCYHMAEVSNHPDHAQRWSDAVDRGDADWAALFEGYGAMVDWPGCQFWRELAAFYPDALVLLTVRDAARWYESASETIFRAIKAELPEGSPMHAQLKMGRKVVGATLGGSHVLDDRALAIEAFERHNAEVQRSELGDRLLVYEVAQGWEPLCERLGVTVPDAEFPRVNSRETFQARMGALAPS